MNEKELLNEYYLQDIVDYYNFIKTAGREKDIPKIEVIEEYIKENSYEGYKK